MRDLSLPTTPEPGAPPGDPERRAFLEAAVLATGLASVEVLSAFAASAPVFSAADMTRLSSFLTGKRDLSDELVARAHHALLAADANFDHKLATLLQKIDAAALSDVEAFKTASLAQDAAIMAIAIAVISAFYTGRVGSNYRGHLVSYEEALMYRPTADVTMIPTYSRGTPGWWVEAPTS